jgi:hypothetical protein
VNQLLKQFREMQKMMRGANPAALAAMGGGGGGKLSRIAAARELAKSGGAEDSLSQMLAGRAGSSAAAPAPLRPGAKGRAKNKKKGGRVTPPGGR